MKKIVLYNVDKEIIDKYKEIKEFENIKFSSVFDEDLNVIVDDIFDLNKQEGKSEVFKKSYMIMSNVSSDDLNYLNKILRDNNLVFKGIKVMKTEYNKQWALKALLEEVSEEDEIMSRVTILRKLIMSTNDMDLDKYDESLSFGLKQALLKGYVLLKSKDLNVEKLDESIENIKYFLNAMGVKSEI